MRRRKYSSIKTETGKTKAGNAALCQIWFDEFFAACVFFFACIFALRRSHREISLGTSTEEAVASDRVSQSPWPKGVW
jgi:hypothetical protein